MQLIPATAERFDVKDAWDPEQNLRGGMAYLRWLLQRFDGDVWLALAGYNAGEQAVERYKGIPPYPETRDYVDRIAGWLNR
jgi:soluble lytic murein transglycosylase-like protein